jgi:CARDB protein
MSRLAILVAIGLPLAAGCTEGTSIAAGQLLAGPNLKPVEVSIFTTKWEASTSHRATITWRVVNDGTQPVTSSHWTRLLANGVTYDVAANSLAVGESVYFSRTITLPTSGLLSFTITADNAGAISEDNESDNWVSGSLDGKKPADGQWYSIGPSRMYHTSTGALSAVAVQKNNANVIYAGGVQPSGGSGEDGEGVWKTTDGGATWNPIGNSLPTMKITAIAIDPTAEYRLVIASPSGIFRSEDYGGSWRKISSQAGGARLFIHPTAPNKLYMNSGAGIMRSLDSGFTWSNVLSVKGGMYGDLDLDPTNSNRLIAPVRVQADNAGSGLYESLDGGSTWHRLIGCAGGLLPNAADKSQVAATGGGKTYYVVRGGGTWKLYRPTTGTCNVNGVTETAWAASPWVPPDIPAMWSDIFVDPTNGAKVFATGTQFWTSTNSGTSFSNSTDTTHVDHHGLAFYPNDPAILFAVSDGGIYRRDAGGTWFFIGEGLQSAHIYDIANGPGAQSVIAGFQDNGTNTYDGTSLVWSVIGDGDGEGVAIDSGGGRSYWMGQHIDQLRVRVSGVNTLIGCGLPSEDSNYDFLPDPFTAAKIWVASGAIYARSTQSPDCSPSAWQTVVPASTGNFRELGVDTAGQLFWAGTTDGRIFAAKSSLVSSAWPLVYDTDDDRAALDIEVDTVDPTVIYLAFSGTGAKRVVRLKRPASWTPGPLTGTAIAGGLPSGLNVRAVAIDRMFTDRVYVGTNNGVYRGITTDGGATFTWSLYASGMPASLEVTDLETHPKTGVMRASTFGQGVFEVYTQRKTFTVTASKTSLDGVGSGFVMSNPGGISCGTDCSQLFEFGTTVVLTANPSEGSAFVSWTGCPAASGNTCSITNSADASPTARFGCSESQCFDSCQDACLDSGQTPGQCLTLCNDECSACY